MKEVTFHYCAMAVLGFGSVAYTDGCFVVPKNGTLDLDQMRKNAAACMAKDVGREADSLNITLLSVTRLTP